MIIITTHGNIVMIEVSISYHRLKAQPEVEFRKKNLFDINYNADDYHYNGDDDDDDGDDDLHHPENHTFGRRAGQYQINGFPTLSKRIHTPLFLIMMEMTMT